MKKIYFAGSIRGGRADAELYQRIIAAICENNEVLTEHVGAASLDAMGEDGMSDREIYEKDVARLRACDMVIAECSTPSLGVGYELAFAEALGKPVHIFHNPSRGALSAMLTGNGYFDINYYTGEDELFARLAALL